jgi:hypothetical protein
MATVTPGIVWVSGETVTPAKLNSAAAPTVAVADDEITTAKILDANVTEAKLAATLDLSSKTVTLPDASVAQAKLAANVVGNGPAFRAYKTTTQTISQSVNTKVTLETESFDTNNNFASSRFTPTVAGYYQVNASVYVAATANILLAMIYKNGAEVSRGSYSAVDTYVSNVSDLIYMNGSSDYIELFAVHADVKGFRVVGTTHTFMSGFLVRAA